MTPAEKLQRMLQSVTDISIMEDEGFYSVRWVSLIDERTRVGSSLEEAILRSYDLWLEDEKELNKEMDE